MSRKIEILIGIVILVLIISFFGYKFLEDRIDEEAELDRLEEALATRDPDYLKDHIEVEELDRELTGDEIEDIADLVAGISLNGLQLEKESPESNIYLIEEGNIFSKEYKLGLKVYDLIIGENPEGTEVFLNGESIGSFAKGEDFIYRGLVPGYHKLGLSYKGEFGGIEKEEEIVAFRQEGGNEIDLDLKIAEKYIQVSSSEEKAELILNGEKTGIKIHEPYELGPLGDEEVIISARALIDGELYESEPHRIDSNSSGSYYLEIDYNPGLTEEEIISRINALIHSYQISFVSGVNTGMDNVISMYMQEGSPLMKSQKKLIKDFYREGIKEDLLSYEIKDINIISQEKVLVTVEEDHMVYYSGGSQEAVNNTWVYTAVYDNERYLLRELN